MMQRLSCRECKNPYCGNAGSGLTVAACSGYTNQKPQTNYDLLISKTPEELAEWLDNIGTAFEPETIVSQQGWLAWMKQEVAESEC